MKICDLTQAYAETSGGIRTYLTEKTRFIRERTEDEHILLIPGNSYSVERTDRIRKYTVKGIPVPGCKPYRFMYRLDKIIRILEDEHPDIIEIGSPYVLPLAVFRYRRKRSCTTVGFYHTDFPEAYIATFARRFQSKHMQTVARKSAERYARYIYNKCDITVASSDLMIRKLRSMEIERVHTIQLGVDPATFNPLKRDLSLRDAIGIRNEEILLLYAGRLDNEKRISVLLDAFNLIASRFPGKLALVGDGPQKALAQAYAKNNDKLVILPYQKDRQSLARMLASSDIYVTAGPHETFGLSILEAQASGLPVVGVRAGAVPERVNEDIGVVCDVDDPRSIASGIMELALNGYKARGRRARSIVEKEYSWDATFTRLFRLYTTLLNHEKR
jgi:alpha-1,6-mannosyltransferase